MTDQTKHLKSFDKKLKLVGKQVEKYEKQPIHKKLPDQFDNIKKQIDDINNNIEEIESIIGNPDQYEDPDSIDLEDLNDHDKFSIYLDEIEEIRKKFNSESISIYKEINLYLKLHSLVNWCNNYIDQQKMTIIQS